MAQMRVLFRFHLGLPYRQAGDSEKERLHASIAEMFKEWRSKGINLVGTFGAMGSGVGGFAHYAIFNVDDLDVVSNMNHDIFTREASKYIEDFDFAIGWSRPFIEDVWAD